MWLIVIRLESTDYASSTNTFGLLYRIATSILGPISPRIILALNSDLRKWGHFLGYAILGWLVFRALKLTQHKRLRLLLHRRLGIFLRDLWRWDWAVIGVLFAAVTASFDEFHQLELASRSGRWQDVLLDTTGALVAQVILYFHARYRLEHPVRRKRRA